MNATQLSHADIETLKELRPGWEEVWNRVLLAINAMVDDSTTPFGAALRYVCRFQKGNRADTLCDFANFVLLELCEKLKGKRLLHNYDHSRPDANLFDWLCNVRNLKQLYTKYRDGDTCKKVLRPKRRKDETDEDLKRRAFVTVNHFGDREPNSTEPELQEDGVPDNRQTGFFVDIDALRAVCDAGKLFVNVKGAQFAKPEIYGGLQLYPALNRLLETMLKLLEQVEERVQQTTTQAAAPWIESEHEFAQEEYEREIESISQKRMTCEQRKRLRLERKLNGIVIRQLLYPLTSDQVATLFAIEKNSAEQQKKRYREMIEQSRLLPDGEIIAELAKSLSPDIDEEL